MGGTKMSSLPKAADVVIIGGGVQGCAVAYNLAKFGVKNIVLIEKGTLCCGSTGRCGAGIRAQWGTEMNCRLGKASLDIFENLTEELGMDIGLHQGGYLMIAYTEKEFEQLKKNVQLQNSLGIKSKVLDHKEALEICPYLSVDDAIGFTFHQRDGHADPFLTTYAYAEAAKRLGVKIFKFTECKDIKVEGGKVKAVVTNKGEIATPVVVNTAGGYSHVVAKMVGLDLPIFSEMHEILITEPVERFSEPMFMSFSGNFYIQQRPHGSIIMGYGPEEHEKTFECGHTVEFIEVMAKKVTKLLPITRGIRVVRQWSGLYNITPDRQPVICEADEVKGFYMSIGFSGHGFMFAPICGKLLAELITKGETSIPIHMLHYNRFEKGELILEPAVV